MKKRLAPFISGIGAGLCLAVVILAVWGLILPDDGSLQAGTLDQEDQAMAEANSSAGDAAEGTGDVPPEQTNANAAQTEGQASQGAGSADTPKQDGYKVVEIVPGMSATQIAELLEKEGVITSSQEFHDVIVREKKTQRFIAGKFTVRCGAPYEELISVLTSQPNTQ